MKINKQTIRILNLIFGILSIIIFIFSLIVLLWLKPKMVSFETLTNLEDALLTGVGLGLLVIMAFYLLSLWQFVRYLRHGQQIKPFLLFLIISGVLSLLFVFSDVALLTDIHKQYTHGLSQPEWALVLPILTIQFIIAIIFLYIHISSRYMDNQDERAIRDINIFIIVQYVGVISGSMGLVLASLGFIYSSGWNMTLHGIMGGIVLLFPYCLAIFYWLVTKFQEQDRQWFDEKQSIDIGKSALVTLSVNTFLMLILFITNFNYLDGIIQKLWLPIYLFATIFIFSLGNLYFSRKV